MADDSDPPRKYYTFKPREFETVNGPRPGQPPPPAPAATPAAEPASEPTHTREHGMVQPAQDPTARIDVRELAQIAKGNLPLLGVNGPVNRPNDVHTMLRDNTAKAEAAGLHEVNLVKRRRSKRNRDYWVMLIGGNAGIMLSCGRALFGELVHRNFAALIAPTNLPTSSLLVLYTVGITWVMFAVMDDY